MNWTLNNKELYIEELAASRYDPVILKAFWLDSEQYLSDAELDELQNDLAEHGQCLCRSCYE